MLFKGGSKNTEARSSAAVPDIGVMIGVPIDQQQVLKVRQHLFPDVIFEKKIQFSRNDEKNKISFGTAFDPGKNVEFWWQVVRTGA